jgi:hypothetical protein
LILGFSHMGLKALVDFTPCMNAEDLNSGLSAIK